MIIAENTLGSQNIQEFEELLNIYKEIKVDTFIEIGSLYGWALRHFIKYANPNATGISVDLPVREFVGPYDHRVNEQERLYREEWPQWAKENKCKLYLVSASSLFAKTLESVKDILKDRSVDFLFIDGDHRYEAIKSDFNMYSPLVRRGGVVAFHDIGKNEEGGGHKFWNEIKHSYKNIEILKDSNSEKGIGVIYL